MEKPNYKNFLEQMNEVFTDTVVFNEFQRFNHEWYEDYIGNPYNSREEVEGVDMSWQDKKLDSDEYWEGYINYRDAHRESMDYQNEIVQWLLVEIRGGFEEEAEAMGCFEWESGCVMVLGLSDFQTPWVERKPLWRD